MLRERRQVNPSRFRVATYGAALLVCCWAVLSGCERPGRAVYGIGETPLNVEPVALARLSSVEAAPVQPVNANAEGGSGDAVVVAEPTATVEDGSTKDASGSRDVAQELPEPLYLAPIGQPVNGGKALSERFANLQPWECRAELARRKIAVRRANMPAPGVATPIRLNGRMGSVRYVTPGVKSKYGILDCRLALLLDELAPRLSALSVKEVHIGNMYRPNSRLPGKRKAFSQHAHGLAIDIFAFVLTDGTVLEVERDFHGALREPTCGAEAFFSEKTREAVLMRNIVCELARVGAFNYFLTPNCDISHRNHLHGDIKRGTRDHVVH